MRLNSGDFFRYDCNLFPEVRDYKQIVVKLLNIVHKMQTVAYLNYLSILVFVYLNGAPTISSHKN